MGGENAFITNKLYFLIDQHWNFNECLDIETYVTNHLVIPVLTSAPSWGRKDLSLHSL